MSRPSWRQGFAFLIVVAASPLCPPAAALVAYAAPAKPPTDSSYYVRTTNTTTLYNLGCAQGNFDRNHGNVNSEVILDFGGQASGNNGTLLTGSNAFVSYATVESLAENFAKGYYVCTGADTTSYVKLGMGTNNSAYHIDTAGGSAWGGVVNVVKNWVSTNGYASQVFIGGANDMEPAWDGYTATKAWVTAYSSAPGGPFLLNYGSADGCPQTTHTNGLCYPYTTGGSWYQDSVWYVSYGAPPAYPTPEIYVQSQANQWGQIRSWKYMSYQGPLDEYPLDTSTFTSSQAWTALSNASGGNPGYFSLEIRIAS